MDPPGQTQEDQTTPPSRTAEQVEEAWAAEALGNRIRQGDNQMRTMPEEDAKKIIVNLYGRWVEAYTATVPLGAPFVAPYPTRLLPACFEFVFNTGTAGPCMLKAALADPDFASSCDQHTYEATKALYGMTSMLASAF